MKKLKAFVKKYFSSFAFFYSYLRNKIFVAFVLSITVSFLDGLGLTMFFPLLKVVESGGENADSSQMGKLSFILDGLEYMGISLTLASILLVMLAFFIFKGIAKYIGKVYLVILKQSFIRKIRLNLLKHLNRMSFKQFILSDAGRIQNTMSGEVARVTRAFSSYFSTFQKSVMIAVYMGFAFAVDWQFAILVSVGGGLTNFLYKIIYKYTKGASRRLTRFNHIFQGQIIQHVRNFKYLKATGMVGEYGKQLQNTIYKIEESRRRIGILSGIGTSAREPLMVVIIASVIYVQVEIFSGNIGTILISLVFFYRALTSLVSMQQQWNKFMEVSGSLENMQDFQKYLRFSRENNGKRKFKTLENAVSFQDVNFAYDETPILNNINLKINKNQSIAFVGESGSGKTTLVNLIAGLLQQNEGQIKIDNHDFKELDKKTYQERVGYVSQDPVIFNDTIYNNITFWAEQTPENLNRFEKSVEQASLDQFLGELPDGKDTALGHNGINLSGGQKQRVSIARELFKAIDILILDEATSALDSETEMAIQKSIDALRGQYTILIVAHRLSTIRNVDQVVLMDKGNIVDIASFEELVQKQERFRKMVELQEL